MGAIAAILGLALVSSSPGQSRANEQAAATAARKACAEYAARAQKYVETGEIAATTTARLEAYNAARELGLRALAINDRDPDALFVVFAAEGRITLLEGEGSLPNPYNLYKAQGKLDHLLELAPDHPNALAAKGGLYRQLPWALGGDLDKAEVYLKRAIDSNPNAIGARIELAQTYRDMGKPERCGPLLDAASRLAREQDKPHRAAEASKLRAELRANN